MDTRPEPLSSIKSYSIVMRTAVGQFQEWLAVRQRADALEAELLRR